MLIKNYSQIFSYLVFENIFYKILCKFKHVYIRTCILYIFMTITLYGTYLSRTIQLSQF